MNDEKPVISAETIQELHAKADNLAAAVGGMAAGLNSVPQLHVRLSAIEAAIGSVWHKVLEIAEAVAKIGIPVVEAVAAVAPGAVGAAARAVEAVAVPIIEAVCPDHPGAGVIDNACSVPGCTKPLQPAVQ